MQGPIHPETRSIPLRVVVLASGRGSNLQALLDAQADATFRVVGVVSDREQATALDRARSAHVPTVALDPAQYAGRDAFDAALRDVIDAFAPDLVVCAGYLRILADATVAHYAGRIVNIHPSLLPRFPGLRTHAQALAERVDAHGASVHFVIPALDAGPVIAQVRVPVHPGDTAKSLAARVLAREHPLLVRCVGAIAAGRVFQQDSAVVVDGRVLDTPMLLDDGDRLVAPMDT